jgi:hypothetical protein
MPFPYTLTIKVPGSIEQSNGTKLSSDTVRWEMQGLRANTVLSVTSKALAFPDVSILFGSLINFYLSLLVNDDTKIAGAKDSPANFAKTISLIASILTLLAPIAGCILIIHKLRKGKSVVKPSEVVDDGLFCVECGGKNPPDSLFCVNCGTKV